MTDILEYYKYINLQLISSLLDILAGLFILAGSIHGILALINKKNKKLIIKHKSYYNKVSKSEIKEVVRITAKKMLRFREVTIKGQLMVFTEISFTLYMLAILDPHIVVIICIIIQVVLGNYLIAILLTLISYLLLICWKKQISDYLWEKSKLGNAKMHVYQMCIMRGFITSFPIILISVSSLIPFVGKTGRLFIFLLLLPLIGTGLSYILSKLCSIAKTKINTEEMIGLAILSILYSTIFLIYGNIFEPVNVVPNIRIIIYSLIADLISFIITFYVVVFIAKAKSFFATPFLIGFTFLLALCLSVVSIGLSMNYSFLQGCNFVLQNTENLLVNHTGSLTVSLLMMSSVIPILIIMVIILMSFAVKVTHLVLEKVFEGKVNGGPNQFEAISYGAFAGFFYLISKVILGLHLN